MSIFISDKDKINDCFKSIDKVINFEKGIIGVLKKGISEKKLEQDEYDELYKILYTLKKSKNKNEANQQLKNYIDDKKRDFIDVAIEIRFPSDEDEIPESVKKKTSEIMRNINPKKNDSSDDSDYDPDLYDDLEKKVIHYSKGGKKRRTRRNNKSKKARKSKRRQHKK